MLYVGSIMYASEKEYSNNFVTGIFEDPKKCIDSILIGLIDHALLRINPNKDLKKLLLNICRILKKEFDVDNFLGEENNDSILLNFLKKVITNKEELQILFDYYTDYNPYRNVMYFIEEREIGNTYSIREICDRQMVLNNEAVLINKEKREYYDDGR
jgi:hypothetical protein